MYSLTSANRYYLYQGFVRMNLGIDGLFKIIRSDRKSTRLNSSHVRISYAVFCLKKKKVRIIGILIIYIVW